MKNFLAHSLVITWSFTVAHYGQIITSGRFAYFDYGCEKNRIVYNQDDCKPPEIPIGNIKLEKIAISHSPTDLYSGASDIAVLRRKLKGNNKCSKRISLHQ